MNCPDCNGLNNANAKFCVWCNSRFVPGSPKSRSSFPTKPSSGLSRAARLVFYPLGGTVIGLVLGIVLSALMYIFWGPSTTSYSTWPTLPLMVIGFILGRRRAKDINFDDEYYGRVDKAQTSTISNETRNQEDFGDSTYSFPVTLRDGTRVGIEITWGTKSKYILVGGLIGLVIGIWPYSSSSDHGVFIAGLTIIIGLVVGYILAEYRYDADVANVHDNDLNNYILMRVKEGCNPTVEDEVTEIVRSSVKSEGTAEKSKRERLLSSETIDISEYCPECNEVNPPNSTHCISCGLKLPRKICSECGTENVPRAKYCMGCGEKR